MNQPTKAVCDLEYKDTDQLYISEIFFSIQGEGTKAGMPCIFVRLQGCTLRCSWCDTKYALDHRTGGTWMSLKQIRESIASYNCRFVEFSGGEPLEQENIYPLLRSLCNDGYVVAIETGGHVDAQFVDPRVIRIIDVKCPASKMQSLNYEPNLRALRQSDEIKFVIANREDYLFARDIVRSHSLASQCAAVLFSPSFAQMDYQELCTWILEDAIDVRLQLQLHKYIWSPDTRGV